MFILQKIYGWLHIFRAVFCFPLFSRNATQLSASLLVVVDEITCLLFKDKLFPANISPRLWQMGVRFAWNGCLDTEYSTAHTCKQTDRQYINTQLCFPRWFTWLFDEFQNITLIKLRTNDRWKKAIIQDYLQRKSTHICNVVLRTKG